MWYFIKDTKITDELPMILELCFKVTGDRAIDEKEISH